jgi:hypothetical protein
MLNYKIGFEYLLGHEGIKKGCSQPLRNWVDWIDSFESVLKMKVLNKDV